MREKQIIHTVNEKRQRPWRGRSSRRVWVGGWSTHARNSKHEWNLVPNKNRDHSKLWKHAVEPDLHPDRLGICFTPPDGCKLFASLHRAWATCLSVYTWFSQSGVCGFALAPPPLQNMLQLQKRHPGNVFFSLFECCEQQANNDTLKTKDVTSAGDKNLLKEHRSFYLILFLCVTWGIRVGGAPWFPWSSTE